MPSFLSSCLARSWPSSSASVYSGRVVVLFPSAYASVGLPAPQHRRSLRRALHRMFATNPFYSGQYGLPFDPLVDDQTGEPFPTGSEAEIQSVLPSVMDQLGRRLTPHDVLVLPMRYNDYIPRDNLTALLNKTGARSAVYLLGVSFPDDPDEPSFNNVPGLIVGYSSELITQGLSQILPLSNFIHGFHGLPHSSRGSVLLSPMESVFYQHAEAWRRAHPTASQRIALKENLVLVDSDLKGDLVLEPDLLNRTHS